MPLATHLLPNWSPSPLSLLFCFYCLRVHVCMLRMFSIPLVCVFALHWCMFRLSCIAFRTMHSHAMYVPSIYACSPLCIIYSSIRHPAMHVACILYTCVCVVRLRRMHARIQDAKQCECFVYIPYICMRMMCMHVYDACVRITNMVPYYTCHMYRTSLRYACEC